MKTLAGKVWIFLQSRSLALVLLAMIIAAVILAQLLGLTLIASSWGFLALLALLWLNTLACTITRIVTRLKKAGRGWESLSSIDNSRLINRTEIETPQNISDIGPAVENTMRHSGYRASTVVNAGTTVFYAEKGRLGEWGSIAFHLGLVVALLGILYSRIGRFEGLMVITEGQTITEQKQDYLAVLKSPALGENHRGFQMRLDELHPVYFEGGTGIDYTARLTILENGHEAKKTVLKVNRPLVYRGTTFLLERYGFAPHFTLRDAAGEKLFDSFVNLRVLEENSDDSFTIPGNGITVTVKFYPDMKLVDGQVKTASLLPNNPVMHLVVRSSSGELFNGLVPIGDPAKFGELTLSFDEVRYWTQYRVVQDTAGQAIIFGGFWLGVLGMLTRYLYIEKKLWVVAESRDGMARLVVTGMARQFDWLYAEEFTKIVNRLEKNVRHGSG